MDEPVAHYIAAHLDIQRYKLASYDLDGDGRPEALVYADGDQDCGSGGCDLYVLTRAGASWRVVVSTSVMRPPIRVLPTSSHGWRDLSVFVAGGGILPGHAVRLRFDGTTYPSNPTVPPAEPIRHPGGHVLIARPSS
jgi:hypothetical protein